MSTGQGMPCYFQLFHVFSVPQAVVIKEQRVSSFLMEVCIKQQEKNMLRPIDVTCWLSIGSSTSTVVPNYNSVGFFVS